VKENKLTKARETYDELLLAITTDEPMIDEELAMLAVANCKPNVSLIRRAFLLVSYQPDANTAEFPDGCPVLRIPLEQK